MTTIEFRNRLLDAVIEAVGNVLTDEQLTESQLNTFSEAFDWLKADALDDLERKKP